MDNEELQMQMGEPFQNYDTICGLNAAMTYLAGAGANASCEQSMKEIIKAMSSIRNAMFSEYCGDVHSWNVQKD
jgi:hypothetical protein